VALTDEQAAARDQIIEYCGESAARLRELLAEAVGLDEEYAAARQAFRHLGRRPWPRDVQRHRDKCRRSKRNHSRGSVHLHRLVTREAPAP